MAYGGSTNTDCLSDETFDLLCRVCKRNSKNKEAQKYCLECKDYYCLKCVKVHDDVPSLTGHKILDKSQFPSRSIKKQQSAKTGSSKQQSMAPTERCDRHTHHYIDMYCQNHDDVGCGTCMAVDHRLCQDIFYIPEFLQNNASPSTPRDIQQKLESVSKTLKVHHENLQREKQQLLKRKAELVENIRKFRKEINDRLDELEKNTVADIEDKYKILINKIEEGMKLLDTNKANVTSARDKLASADNNVSQDFVNAKKGKDIARSAAKYLEDNKSLIHTNDTDFLPDQRILSLLKEINTFGKTIQRSTMSTDVTGKTQQTAKKEQKCSASGNVQQTETLLQVKGSKKYSVSIQSDDTYCNIVSACTLKDGTIILSDRSNKKLKRIDSSTFTVTDYCDLPEQPWQVCAINNHQVAVCLTAGKEVNFVEVRNRMTITNTIKTDFDCYGLAYAGGNLYISDDDTSVYIYSVSGGKLKQLSKDQEGQAMFSDIRSLDVTVDGSRIYVTDWNKGLIVLDSNGQVVGKFNGLQLLKYADGSFLTAKGSLLVCGNDSKNVLQFGQNGELIGEVVKPAGDIYAICCNQQMSKMIISQWKGDEIEVYDLV